MSRPTFNILHYETLESTNTFAKELIRNPPNGHQLDNTVILCDHQSRGRGRHGRAWASLPGNLFMTLIWPAKGTQAEEAQQSGDLALVTGFGVATWVRRYVTEGKVILKWPNDVLVNGAKLAGILIEMEPPYAVIGIGLNLRAAPAEVDPGRAYTQATFLGCHSKTPIDVQRASQELLDELARVLEAYQKGGLAPFVAQMAPFFSGV